MKDERNSHHANLAPSDKQPTSTSATASSSLLADDAPATDAAKNNKTPTGAHQPYSAVSQERLARIERLAQVALLSALALALSYLETMIPLPFAVPGIKLGLANVAVLVALYLCDVRTATFVMLVKVLASGFLFGSPLMLAYSAGGTALAFAGMLACRAIPWVDVIPTSMIAAILHNVGQLAVAAIMLSTTAVFLTLPVLAIAACVTGFLTGLVAAVVLATVPKPNAHPYSFDQEEFVALPGKVTAIVGRNGSGKTTLALQMAGLLPAQARASTQSFTGIAFQNPDDQIVFSIAEDDVAFGLENQGANRESMRLTVEAALDKIGIASLAKREVSKLSGGEKQQVATAGLVALSPSTIVFDESAAMLSPLASQHFWAQARTLASEGRAVVVITHDIDAAFSCDQLAVVNEGSVEFQGFPTELAQTPDLANRLACWGLEMPFILKFKEALEAEGVPANFFDPDTTPGKPAGLLRAALTQPDDELPRSASTKLNAPASALNTASSDSAPIKPAKAKTPAAMSPSSLKGGVR